MAILEDLPLEVLKKIVSELDRDSILAATNVCISWKIKFHDVMTPTNCDQHMKDKLEKCGWIMSEHNVEHCKCIELRLGLYKYIGNISMSCKEKYEDMKETEDPYYGMDYGLSKSKLCIVSNADDDYSRTMSVNDLVHDKSEAIELEMYLEEHRAFDRGIGVYAYGNTLAVLESYHEHILFFVFGREYDNEEKMKIANTKKVHLWNLNSLDHVFEFSITDHAKDYFMEDYNPDDEFNFEITVGSISMSVDKLAVNLTIAYQERNSTGEFGRKDSIDHIQIWKIDTSDPSNENISYLTTIESDMVKRVHLNSKFLCTTHGTYFSNEKFELGIYNLDDLDDVDYSSKVFGKATCIKDPEKYYHIMLYPGDSNKIAVVNKRSKILKIYKLDGEEKILVQLSEMIADESLKFQAANFIMGKIVLLWANDREFKFLIVTEDGHVIDGNKQEFRHFVDKRAVFHVEVDGMLVIADTDNEGLKEKIYLYHY